MENMGTASADTRTETSISVVTQIASNDPKIETVQNPSSEVETEVPVGTEISYDDLVNDIIVSLGDLTHLPSSGICIYRVPENIRKLDEDAYTPQVISIGPYHHGNKNFLLMENCKWTYFQAFIQRSGVNLNRYVELMKDSESRARANYADTIEMSSDEFVKMMLVDGCFILEFLGRFNRVYREVQTFIIREGWLVTRLYYDLILLENQIPFFILESIYHLAVPTPNSNDQLHGYIHPFLSQINQSKSPDDIDFGKVMHFTDLIREFYLPLSRGLASDNDSEIKFVCTATQLHEAGVKFKEGSSKCLLDVKFIRGVLEFPRLTLHDGTKYIFRNLMALEVCHYSRDTTPIIDYVFFLDRIIDTPNDVDLLVKNGMLDSSMGSTSEVADIVNNLGKKITYDRANSYLIPLCKDLNVYYNLPKNRWRAALKRDYFRTPWRTAATIGAIMLLLLTLMQSICSVKSIC